MSVLYSIPHFYGFKKGVADNLIERGFASNALNVDTTDGALQTVIGSTKCPVEFSDVGGYHTLTAVDPAVLMWRRPDGTPRFVTKSLVFNTSGIGLAEQVRNFSAGEQALLAPFCTSPTSTVLLTRVGGIPSALLCRPNYQPVVIEDGSGGHDCLIRKFGTGDILSSDAITGLFTVGTSITGVEIGRVMTADEQSWCLMVGVYLMENSTDTEAYAASKVSSIVTDATTTQIFFETGLEGVEVGHYIKVRGGCSDMKNHIFVEYYGRLLAAGDPYHPNRLYWSCLPGDGRTVEDWTMDDASVDTGGGHVEVGLDGEIRAMFAMPSQVLIFKDHEIYRLYGSTPSQYTLERIFHSEAVVIAAQRAVADVYGVPYWANAEGLWAYNGSVPQRIDGDRSLQDYLREYSLDASLLGSWPLVGTSAPTRCEFCNDRLFVSENTGKSVLMFDLSSGSCTEIRLHPYGRMSDMRATETGLVYSVYQSSGVTYDTWRALLLGFTNAAYLDRGAASGWEAAYHKYSVAGAWSEGWEGPVAIPVDAVWESPELTFGEPSYKKRLTRFGFEITGSVKVTVSSAEGAHWERVFLDATDRYRRFEWLTVDMPFEASVKFRFESVDGRPFRIHSGLDCYVDLSKRN